MQIKEERNEQQVLRDLIDQLKVQIQEMNMQKMSNDRDMSGKNMRMDELQSKIIEYDMKINSYESEIERLNIIIRDKDDEI